MSSFCLSFRFLIWFRIPRCKQPSFSCTLQFLSHPHLIFFLLFSVFNSKNFDQFLCHGFNYSLLAFKQCCPVCQFPLLYLFLSSFFFFWEGGGCVSQRNSRYMFFLRTSFSFICMTISSARIRFTLGGYRFLC